MQQETRAHRWFVWVHLWFIPQMVSFQDVLHCIHPEAIHPLLQPEVNKILK